jgi:hypothetical protein
MDTGRAFYTAEDLARTYEVNKGLIHDLARRLGLGRKYGKMRLFAGEDVPILEIGLRTRGYKIPEPALSQR